MNEEQYIFRVYIFLIAIGYILSQFILFGLISILTLFTRSLLTISIDLLGIGVATIWLKCNE